MLLLLLACSGPSDDSPSDSGDSGTADSAADSGADSGDSAADSGDTAADSGDTAADSGDSGTTDVCAGLTVRPWDASGTTGDFEAIAPDLSVTLLDGSTWTWSEHFTGCDSLIGVTWMPDYAYPDLSRAAKVKQWLETSPRNVHYLVYASAADPVPALEGAYDTFVTAVSRLDDTDAQAWWLDHVHFTTDDPYGDSWVGVLNQTYRIDFPINWGVDRTQHVRELGYLGDPLTGWTEYPASFLNYEVERFNQESDRDDRQAAQGATVVRAFDAEPQSEGWVSTVTFPDVSGYDTLELDLTMACYGHPEATYCGEWDYLVYAWLCPVDDAGTEEDESATECTQVGRFITAYARGGRWTVDASPFLALLRGGGDRVVRFSSSNAYFLTLDFRLYDQGSGYRPLAVEYLWSGGAFNEAYDDLHPPVAFTPPDSATRVDVFGLISGHGYGQDRANCAEFCNHQHEFSVNDAGSWMKEEPEAGSSYGCAEQVGEQTLPNQYGTWVYGRGGWCPGKQVDPFQAEVTDAVDFAGENVINYRGLFEGETYVPQPYDSGYGFGAQIDGATWLVYYEDAR